jgi:hypothetical protein
MKLMKNLSLIFVLGLSIILIQGCDETKYETSEVLHEPAEVVALIYNPARHDTSVSPAFGDGKSIVGMGWDGKMGVKVGGVVISSTTVPEVYGALFRCQHGTFVSQGSDIRHRALYQSLKQGQKVDVIYTEIYKCIYRIEKGQTEKRLVERVLYDRDFLDAVPVEEDK